MSDFAPPTGPPPPKLPEGWKAVWNAQYSEWFFVNIYTKKSQWDKPTSPVYPSEEGAPDGPPPTYAPAASGAVHTDDKKLSSNNPYASGRRPSHELSEDEALARRLQEEENARAGRPGDRGLADQFYQQHPEQQGGYGGGYQQGNTYPPQGQSPYPQAESPYQDYSQTGDKGKSKGGFLGKLLGGGKSSRPNYSQPQQQYGAPQQGYYNQQPGYGAPAGGYYGGQQQQMYAQQPQRKHGLGTGGAAALGVGGGLLGGVLLGEALEGGDNGGDGGDYGGGDGGGDFGGGDGGGDFGGGDF